MKLVRSIIQPDKLGDVRTELEKTGCYRGISITEIMGQGSQKGITQTWRGEKYRIDLIPKIMIDLVVKDDDVPAIKEAILKGARSGEFGDGKIFVFNVEEATRIRTGEENEDAL